MALLTDTENTTILQIIKQGWLEKQNRHLKSWRKRWVILYRDKENVSLYTYKQKDAYESPTEIITIDKYTNIFSSNFLFIIQCAITKEEFHFNAPSKLDLNEWVQNIKDMIDPQNVHTVNNDNNTNCECTKTCPNKHVLKKFKTPRETFLCDGCDTKCALNTILFGCRECNYDLCEMCCSDDNNGNLLKSFSPKYGYCSTALYSHDIKEEKYYDSDDNKYHNDDAASRLFYEKSKLWETGKILKVYFMGGQIDVQQKVLKIAQKWSKYCNITFVETNDKNDSDIRIAFNQNQGSWSYIGNHALTIDKDRETMNFGWFKSVDNPDDNEYNTTTLHEFGHVLGFKHEHLHPIDKIPYNKEKVYKYYKKTNNWDKDMVDRNILNRVDPIRVCGFDEKFDKDSIMMYTINPSLLKIPHHPRFDKLTTRNYKLSLIDKQKAYRFYPFFYPQIGSIVTILSKKQVQESFKIATRRRYDAKLYDKYCHQTGLVIGHHTTNGVRVLFDDNIKIIPALWYEPMSMEMLNQNDDIDRKTPVHRLFVGDHVRIIAENSYYEQQEGIIQLHDCETFTAKLVTIAIKPFNDRLVRLYPKEIKKLESHEVHTKEKANKSSDCQCRAMLITSTERTEDAEIMKKYLTKGNHVMVENEDVIAFNKENNDLSKEKLLNVIKNMFNDKKRNNFIIYYSGPSEDNTGNWEYDGNYDQFCISLKDIVNVWQQKKYDHYYHELIAHEYWKVLYIVLDCDYAGKWVDDCRQFFNNAPVIIQASCGKNEKCDAGVFTKRWAPHCIGAASKEWSAGKWIYQSVTFIPKGVFAASKALSYDLLKVVYNLTYSFKPCSTVEPSFMLLGDTKLHWNWNVEGRSIAYTSTHNILMTIINDWEKLDHIRSGEIFCFDFTAV
eukprot:254381_1